MKSTNACFYAEHSQLILALYYVRKLLIVFCLFICLLASSQKETNKQTKQQQHKQQQILMSKEVRAFMFIFIALELVLCLPQLNHPSVGGNIPALCVGVHTSHLSKLPASGWVAGLSLLLIKVRFHMSNKNSRQK